MVYAVVCLVSAFAVWFFGLRPFLRADKTKRSNWAKRAPRKSRIAVAAIFALTFWAALSFPTTKILQKITADGAKKEFFESNRFKIELYADLIVERSGTKLGPVLEELRPQDQAAIVFWHHSDDDYVEWLHSLGVVPVLSDAYLRKQMFSGLSITIGWTAGLAITTSVVLITRKIL